MHIGFTGTRNGMTPEQRAAVRELLVETPGVGMHGDCIGADADFDAICKELGTRPIACVNQSFLFFASAKLYVASS